MYLVLEVQKLSEALEGPWGKVRIKNEPEGFCPVFKTREEALAWARHETSVVEVVIKGKEVVR